MDGITQQENISSSLMQTTCWHQGRLTPCLQRLTITRLSTSPSDTSIQYRIKVVTASATRGLELDSIGTPRSRT